MNTFSRTSIFVLALLLMGMVACVKQAPLPGLAGLDDPYTVTEHTVRATETDNNISFSGPGKGVQLAYLSAFKRIRKNRLFIMLPGTLGDPNDYKLILKSAASHGYHAIGIAYENNSTLATHCDGSSDVDCSEKLLNEYLTGENTSSHVDISRANSFENRIQKMILYLKNEYPSEGWDQYLTEDGDIEWTKISLAGHSQGSTHTLYISRKRSLYRATFYGGPNGFSSGGFPDWITNEGATSNNKLFAFNHIADRAMEWSDVVKTLNAAGIDENTVNVDVTSNLDNVQRYYTSTSKLLNPIGGAHGSTCADKDTPTNSDGLPRFDKVWVKASFPLE